MPLAEGIEPDAFMPGVRPNPRAHRRVVCFLGFRFDRRFETPPPDVCPRPARSGAAWCCGAVMDCVRSVCLAVSAGPAEPWAICSVLADDADRLHRRISRRRRGG